MLTLTLVGCPGTLDNPGAFPNQTGSAGSTGTAGGGTAGMAMAGSSGSAGTGGLPPNCDPMAMFSATIHNCTLAGACHDAMGSGAGFKMAGTDWQTHLVGVKPMTVTPAPPGGASMCVTNAKAYIVKRPPPVGGLILDKLTQQPPACGAAMPSLGTRFTTTEIACVQAWMNQLAAAAP